MVVTKLRPPIVKDAMKKTMRDDPEGLADLRAGHGAAQGGERRIGGPAAGGRARAHEERRQDRHAARRGTSRS